MTLKLVADNATPTAEPDYADIPAMLRRYANEIEAGKVGEVAMAVLVTQLTDTSLGIQSCGAESTAYELMGIFEAAKLTAFAQDLDE